MISRRRRVQLTWAPRSVHPAFSGVAVSDAIGDTSHTPRCMLAKVVCTRCNVALGYVMPVGLAVSGTTSAVCCIIVVSRRSRRDVCTSIALAAMVVFYIWLMRLVSLGTLLVLHSVCVVVVW